MQQMGRCRWTHCPALHRMVWRTWCTRRCRYCALSRKGLQLRLELGNVVTGEGEREGRVVVGDKTDKVWEGKPTCV